jgi:hypothetical protein
MLFILTALIALVAAEPVPQGGTGVSICPLMCAFEPPPCLNGVVRQSFVAREYPLTSTVGPRRSGKQRLGFYGSEY